jgi:outer membrane protein TolC
MSATTLVAPILRSVCAQEQAADVLRPAEAGACRGSGSSRTMDLADAVKQALDGQPQLVTIEQDVLEARADLKTARAAFLPGVQFLAEDERYVPNNGNSPVIVVGNSVLGGPQVKSAYGSLSLNWNLMSSGRDLAAVHGAQASIRAASEATKGQLADTLMSILQAYADLYEASVAAENARSAATLLQSIQGRAEERYQNGHGTTVAIGQARVAALEAEQALNRTCRTISDKTAALAQSVGMRVSALQTLVAGAPLPMPVAGATDQEMLGDVVESDPLVISAREKIAAARSKQQQAERAFGPTVSLSVRRDYLGQDPDSFGRANHHIAPNDYRIDLSFEQPLFPLMSETAAVDKGRAEVRKAQAAYDEARLEADTKLRAALSSQSEARASYASARSSLDSANRVLALTESLYRAGRSDLDDVQHAQIDRDKAEADARTLASKRAVAEWATARALKPARFADLLLQQLHLQTAEEEWQRHNPY